MSRKPNATFFCSIKLNSTQNEDSKIANDKNAPRRMLTEILKNLYKAHLETNEDELSKQVKEVSNLDKLILLSLSSSLDKIDSNLNYVEINSFRLKKGSIILEFTLMLFTTGIANYETYSAIADKALNFIGADFINIGFQVERNFFSLDNEAYLHNSPNHNAIIQTVTTKLQEFEKNFFQDLGDKLTIVRLLVVFLFMGLIGTFTIYSQKSELEDSLKIRKEISEYLNDLNLLKESGIKVPEDSLKKLEKKPKSTVKSAF